MTASRVISRSSASSLIEKTASRRLRPDRQEFKMTNISTAACPRVAPDPADSTKTVSAPITRPIPAAPILARPASAADRSKKMSRS